MHESCQEGHSHEPEALEVTGNSGGVIEAVKFEVTQSASVSGRLAELSTACGCGNCVVCVGVPALGFVNVAASAVKAVVRTLRNNEI